ncbi:MAG: PAS domain-containing sensor histidine kinase [Treponemataceae bacterium]
MSGLNTFFAPPDRDSPELIEKEARDVGDLDLFSRILNALPEIAFVLNGKRQVIFANDSAAKLLGLACAGFLGRRPGEIVSCVHSGDMPAGCGTGEACRYCGAVNAILESQRTGGPVERECRISVKKGEKTEALDLSVTCKDVSVGTSAFFLLTIRDISDAKRRKVLERAFFHDVVNSIAAVQSGAAMLKSEVDSGGAVTIDDILTSVECLLDEVTKQRDFSAMEHGDLSVSPEFASNATILNDVVTLFKASVTSHEKTLQVDVSATVEKKIFVDLVLIRRVLVNMIKNALEASSAGETVRTWTAPCGDMVRFSVHNVAVMTDEVRHQVFQRSFSTKGQGRGIGTYTMRMLATEYLNGSVDFRSVPGEGTTFWLDVPL